MAETDIYSGLSDEEMTAGFGDEENTTPVVEEEVTEPADQPEEEVEAEEEPAEEVPEEETEPEPEVVEEPAEEKFTLNHLGEIKDYTKEETITLAQKGLDYDRIRQERDALKSEHADWKERIEFLDNLAERSGQTVDEMMVSVMAKLVYEDEQKKGYNITEEQARYRVESEMKAKKKAPAKETAEDPLEKRRNEYFAQFQEDYPDVKPDQISKEVWQEFGDGSKRSLSFIYAKHLSKQKDDQIQQLQAKAETAEQVKENRKRSTGSRRSNGSPVVDHDLDGWGEY